MGQKPLVYAHTEDCFLFASEIKSLLLAPGVEREVDPIALDEYLTYLYVPHPQTMFRGICKLPPAHYAIYRNGDLTIRRYWQVDWQYESNLPVEELRDQLRHRLDEAVRLQLRSDVPIGAFLSGGVDSTTIVGLMQRHLPNPARTFTIGFPVSDFDKSEFARLAAEHLKTRTVNSWRTPRRRGYCQSYVGSSTSHSATVLQFQPILFRILRASTSKSPSQATAVTNCSAVIPDIRQSTGSVVSIDYHDF